MRTEACAKVNFTLEVFGKRVDGYHALRSVVMPVSLADILELDATGDGSIVSDTGYSDDLCIKAAKALRAATGVTAGVSIRVEKHIPAGGGLGGGSADAAAVLLALNELWQTQLPLTALAELGAAVGSDVPALVLGQALREPVLMEGRGERVAPLGPVKALPLVLVNPGVFSSTPEVFRHARPRDGEASPILATMLRALAGGDSAEVAAACQNDLEEPACRLHPEIAAVKRALAEAGAIGVLMSGSGSTVFGLAADDAQALRLAEAMKALGYAAWAARTLAR